MPRNDALNNAHATTIKLPDDVRQLLRTWSYRNFTSQSAEVIRAIRERGERELREQKVA